jgi:hypothetical protein
MGLSRPNVTIRPEGDVYVVTTDFGDVATFHRFDSKRAAEEFVVGRGRSITVTRPLKSPVFSRNTKLKLSKAGAK